MAIYITNVYMYINCCDINCCNFLHVALIGACSMLLQDHEDAMGSFAWLGFPALRPEKGVERDPSDCPHREHRTLNCQDMDERPDTCGPVCLRGQSPGLRLCRRHHRWRHPFHQPASVRSTRPAPAHQPSPSLPLKSWGLDLAQFFRYRNGVAWRLPSKTILYYRPSARKRGGEKKRIEQIVNFFV